MLNVALFGPPGAGKGTQSARLIERYGLHYIATAQGDSFDWMGWRFEVVEMDRRRVDKILVKRTTPQPPAPPNPS